MSPKSSGAAFKRRRKDAPAPSSSSSSQPNPRVRLAYKRRNPRLMVGSIRRGESDVDALALPLGMSIAAVVAQVLEKKELAEERMSSDHLTMLCTSAVRESLTNVFGDRFNCFARNFAKSFQSTLRTIRLINESSEYMDKDHSCHLSTESGNLGLNSTMTVSKLSFANSSGIENSQSEVVLPADESREPLSNVEETGENMQTDSLNLELAMPQQSNQHLACVSSRTVGSFGSVVKQSMLSTFEKSVVEQARSNDLKTYEIGLQLKKLQLKEAELALHTHSNILERFKLSLGISKASFRTEKLKTQLEETRHGELLRNCIDCLVAGMLIMSAALAYGAYIHSYKRITEATASCTLPQEPSKSWWIPKSVSSFNSGLHILRCRVQVVTRMLFGVLMILAVAYLLLQRSAAMKQTMPITFILLLLGVACGFAGKLCVETLGGDGYSWLCYWEALCLLHFFSNVWTSTLFFYLHGPIKVSEGLKCSSSIFPYWLRRYLFYFCALFFLPLFCGLTPFASLSDWKDHFSLLVIDFFSGT